jgi:hypothetical protein
MTCLALSWRNDQATSSRNLFAFANFFAVAHGTALTLGGHLEHLKAILSPSVALSQAVAQWLKSVKLGSSRLYINSTAFGTSESLMVG